MKKKNSYKMPEEGADPLSLAKVFFDPNTEVKGEHNSFDKHANSWSKDGKYLSY